MLAHELDYVLGVDTHRDLHTLAVAEARTGGIGLQTQIAASASGYRQALALAERHARGRRAWAIEGTGSYGAGLCRFLQARGERVLELDRPKRERRSRAKNDAIDAVRAARSLLGRQQLASPRAGGRRDELRALMSARAGALQAKRAALCQLRALIVTAPEPLRAELRGLSRARLLGRLQRLRLAQRREQGWRGTLVALKALAGRVLALQREERQLASEIEALVHKLAPALLAEPGIGPITAAQLLISWSHRGRLPRESCFARLAGAAPIEASSGERVRHRLDCGGDRQLNRALHTIIVARRKTHTATIDYIARRQAEGKSVREAIRCLKRYLARHLYRMLEAMPENA